MNSLLLFALKWVILAFSYAYFAFCFSLSNCNGYGESSSISVGVNITFKYQPISIFSVIKFFFYQYAEILACAVLLFRTSLFDTQHNYYFRRREGFVVQDYPCHFFLVRLGLCWPRRILSAGHFYRIGSSSSRATCVLKIWSIATRFHQISSWPHSFLPHSAGCRKPCKLEEHIDIPSLSLGPFLFHFGRDHNWSSPTSTSLHDRFWPVLPLSFWALGAHFTLVFFRLVRPSWPFSVDFSGAQESPGPLLR